MGGDIKSEVIDSKKLIDQHYYAIASKATILTPDQVNVPRDKFKAHFGKDWDTLLKNGECSNALDACKFFGWQPRETWWRILLRLGQHERQVEVRSECVLHGHAQQIHGTRRQHSLLDC